MDVKLGYKQTEVGVIPEEWEVIPIGEAGQVIGGRQRSPHHVGELCKYLRVANVFDGFIDTQDVLEMPFSPAEKTRFRLEDGDILLNEGQSIELVGRSAIYRGTPEDCYFQNTLVRFRARPCTCPEFAQVVFQHYLQSGVFASIALQTTSIAHLGTGRLAVLKMPLPTKAEQEAIAKALSDADTLIESLEQLIAKKRHVKQGAMQGLISGKQRLLGFETKPGYKQTEVGLIPVDWSIVDYVSFGQVIDGDRGANYPGVGDLRDSGHCLFLDAGNVTKVGFRFAECQFILAEKDKKLNKGKLTRHDVVLTTRGTVGNFAYYAHDVPFEHIRINSGMVILRNISPTVANDYQYLVLRSRIVESQIERLSFGSAQHQLTVKGISTLKIPLPPSKAEQTAIAAILSDMDAEIAALEARLVKARQIKQGMMQELLTGRIRLVGGA